MPSWKKVIVSGSDATLNSLLVSTAFTASGLNYPSSDGTNGQVVTTDGAGNLSFSNVENTTITIKNVSGATIAKGTPCYITGSGTSGNVAGVWPADASNPARMPAGVIAGETLSAGAEGIGLINGFIANVNTAAFNAGNTIYVAVGGGYTNVKPTGSSVLIQKLGNVEKSHASNGSGVINGPNYYNEVPNIQQGYTWVGNSNGVAVAVTTSSIQNVVSSSYALTASYGTNIFTIGSSKIFSEYTSGGTNDALKLRASSTGAVFGVQNTNASGFSGIEYIDNASSVKVFTGYNNDGTGEFRFNNIASNGYITFKIGSSDKLTIANSGNVGVGKTSPNAKLDVDGNTIITGSLVTTSQITVGTGITPSTENTLILGAPPAAGSGEGGQLVLQSGPGYTSGSHIDNWQNQFRILRGTNAATDAVVANFNLHTKQIQFPAYNSTTAFTGTVAGLLAFDSSGNIITTSGGSGGSGTVNGGTAGYVAYYPSSGTTVDDSGIYWDSGNSRMAVGNTSPAYKVDVSGDIRATGAIYANANGAMYFQGGDDVALYDINIANHLGVYGQQDSTVGSIKLGSGGGIISGKSGNIGIGTTNPTSASLQINGNVFASSFTGSLFGTASWATNVVNNGVTSVGGTGTVNGISLSGTVTSTGNLTLGGTLSGIGNSQLTNSVITIAGTSTSLGGSISQATILAGSGVFSGSAQITGLTNSNLSGTAGITNANLANSAITIAGTSTSLGSSITAATILSGTTVLSGSITNYLPAGTVSGSSQITNIANSQLTNSAITIGSTAISLGATSTTLAGLTNVTSTNFTGSLQGTASYALNSLSASFAPTFPFTGSARITGSLSVTGSARISGEGNTSVSSSLVVYGSGSTQPVFTVQGSQGELFSITDSLSGSLFSVNDISGLPIMEVFSDNTTLMGSYQAPSLNTTVKTTTVAGNNVIYSIPTASYNGAWFEYVATSASNARAGQIMSVCSSNTIKYTETTTTDIGTTTGLNFTVMITGSNFALTGSSTTAGWTIKTIVRSI